MSPAAGRGHDNYYYSIDSFFSNITSRCLYGNSHNVFLNKKKAPFGAKENHNPVIHFQNSIRRSYPDRNIRRLRR